MKNSNDYELDLAIDEMALDLEWLEQPSLMLKYTTKAAKARRNLDRIKEKLSVVKAQVEKEIRADPEEFEIVKVTESAIMSTVLLHDSYQEAMKELIDAQYEYQVVQGAVQAVDQRKQALENMTRLLGLQYYAGPKVPRELSYEVKQADRKKKSNLAVNLSRTKR